VIGLILFVWRELSIAAPAVNLRVLRYKTLWAGSLYSIVLGVGLYGTTFVIPVFAQSILHFTATQTGELMIPGSLLMIVTMPLAGTLVNKVDARLLVGLGSLILVTMIVMLSKVNIHTSHESFFWPLMLRGWGLTFMFIPMSVATLSPIPKKDVPAAAGLYNLTRQIGGSIGIALLTFILDHRSAYHAQVLAQRISAFDPRTTMWLQQVSGYLQSRGYDTSAGQQAALKMLSGIVHQQALILSFEDVYLFVAALFICALPLLIFLGKGRAGVPAPDVH
jgi:DHA2 family multidrug resistance protein